MVRQEKYNTGVSIFTVLRTAGSTVIKANPTLASGDVKISKDGGAFANVATLPDAFPAAGSQVRIQLSAAEMQCKYATIIFHDQTATAEWDDNAVEIQTYGNASASLIFDLSQATPAVNSTQLAGQAITAAAGVTFPTSVASPTNITAGTITTVTNLTNAPTVGDFTAAMKSSLNTVIYPNGFIYFNSAAANTNTVLGVDGTPSNPVSTPAAAKTLADALGTKMIYVMGTWTNIVTMVGYYFIGVSHDDIINFNGTDMSNCYFESIDLRGVNTGSTNLYHKVSTLNTYTVAGVVFDSEIGNTVSITGYSNLFNCQPTNTGAMTLVFGASAQSVNINGLVADSVNITAITHASSVVNIVFAGNPDVVIDASCNAGTVNVMGYINSLTDNSTGTCVVNDKRNLTSITADVWDAARSGHVIAGSFGEKVQADLVSIDGQDTDGNNATLNLKKLNIVNDGGDAVVAKSTSVDGNGVNMEGGSNGVGVRIAGPGVGMDISSVNGNAVNITGETMGIGINTDSGNGVKIVTGVDDGILINAAKNGIRSKGGTGHGATFLKGSDPGAHDVNFETPDCTVPVVTDVTNEVSADAVKINSSAPAAVQLAKSANTIADGTVDIVDFAPTTTEFETASLVDPATDFYKTRTVIFASGTLDNQARTIVASSYNAGTGKTHLTVQALTSAPAAGVAFNIV